METLTLSPIQRFDGEVVLPGSKSLSNRALLLAALAAGTTRLTHVLDSDDVRHMRGALVQLGVQIEQEGDAVVVQGCAGRFPVVEATLNLGNSGTSMRLLAAAVSLGRGRYTLDGVPRMRQRPIGDLVEGLRQLGAEVGYLGAVGFPPLRVEAQSLPGGTARVRGTASSQFLSALLLSAPLARETVRLEVEGDLVSAPYVEMTLALMGRFGARVARPGDGVFEVPTGGYASPGAWAVEGDASSASYFLAGAAITGGAVTVRGCGADSLQGDARFARVLERMGARVDYGPDWIAVTGGPLRGIETDMVAMPDAAMTLAVAALFASGTTTIRGVRTWRLKETDRLAAMAAELRKLGAEVETEPDCIVVTPPARWRPAVIETYDDHRMAMAFSLAACGPVPVTIQDPGCVSKTFPDYFTVLRGLVNG